MGGGQSVIIWLLISTQIFIKHGKMDSDNIKKASEQIYCKLKGFQPKEILLNKKHRLTFTHMFTLPAPKILAKAQPTQRH